MGFCKAAKGKKRPLPPTGRSRTKLPALVRPCFLLSVLFLSVSGQAQTVLDAPVHHDVRKTATSQLDHDGLGRNERYPSHRTVGRVRARRNLGKRDHDDELSPYIPPTQAPSQEINEEPSAEHMDKPSLDHTYTTEERNTTDTQFVIELSVAILPPTSNHTLHDSTLEALADALDVIIANDTTYQLDNPNATATTTIVTDQLATSELSQSWEYVLTRGNVTATELKNVTEECISAKNSNETIAVQWLHTRATYMIVLQRPENISQNQGDELQGNETDDKSGEDDNAFDFYRPEDYEETARTVDDGDNPYDQYNADNVMAVVMNATFARIQDGTLLQWIQYQDPQVVGVTQVHREASARCIESDLEDKLPVIPVPLDTLSWDALQVFGSIVCALTLVSTSTLCLVGRSRHKASQEWAATIGDESAVDDFLTLSRQFLPPECFNQRDEKGATHITIPSDGFRLEHKRST